MLSDADMTLAIPLTEEQLAEARVGAIEIYGSAPPDGKFTCDDCGARHRCAFVFDWYNVNGDCLAEK